jgi:DNA-binding transcriptional LysR family regulator
MFHYKDYIYAIYQERSFSKAAQKLYVSQPWLSSVVKKVEQEIQAPLFDRSTTPISLTEAGRYYIEQTEKVIAIERATRAHFRTLANGTQLHIGSSMFFCTYVLPRLMEEFKALYPQIVLYFTEGDNQALTQKLLEHKLDFFLEVEPLEGSKFQSIAWSTEELVLAVPARLSINQTLEAYRYTFNELLKRDEPGGRKPPVPLRAFEAEPFLMLTPGNDSYTRGMELCRHADFTPRVSAFLTQMMTAYYLVCEGQGVAFLRSTIPEYVIPTDSVFFYQLGDPAAVRDIHLSYLKQNMSPVRQKLLNFMRSHSPLEERFI